MSCEICGKSSVWAETLVQIEQLKAKMPKVQKQLDETTDPNLVLKLQNKIKKYNKNIKELEKGRSICEECNKTQENLDFSNTDLSESLENLIQEVYEIKEIQKKIIEYLQLIMKKFSIK